MMDPYKYTPGYKSRSCNYWDVTKQCCCCLIHDNQPPIKDGVMAKHRVLCTRVECYTPDGKPERWQLKHDSLKGDYFIHDNETGKDALYLRAESVLAPRVNLSTLVNILNEVAP